MKYSLVPLAGAQRKSGWKVAYLRIRPKAAVRRQLCAMLWTMKAQKIYWIIPAQFVAHFADEWVFGLPAWVTRHFAPLPEPFWVSMMSVLTVLALFLGWVASRPTAGPGSRLICAAVQMLFFSNAFFHLITTVVFGEYSPGTASGVLLFLPLSVPLWRAVQNEPDVTRGNLVAALIAGFVFHALVLLNLLIDKSAW